MIDPTPTVLIYADLHEFEGEFPEIYKQEWESARSVNSILELLSEVGERPELIGTPEELLEKLKRYCELDFPERPVLFHLMEGFRSRNRESLIPATAELFGFPHTGSDAYCQNLSLDKNQTRIFAQSIGVPIAPGFLIRSAESSVLPKRFSIGSKESSFESKGFSACPKLNFVVPKGFSFPGFLKPSGEGSSLGIGEESIVFDEKDLRFKLSLKPEDFFPYLVEEYLTGIEYTISVMGSAVVGYRVGFAGRLVLRDDLKVEEVYGEKTKSKSVMPETLVFDCPKDLEIFLQEQSLLLCESLGTSGPARLDWKLDSSGNPFFLEINLTPGLSPFYSTFPICYRHSLGDEKTLFQEILQIARLDFETDRFLYSKKKIGTSLSQK
ncbi:D-alanine--D-alanine ligase [Leptospira alstonii]|uniref:D-alanine--D-alanine ligase C-terminal domain protein n=2 Tax=Leptospira alstonii TaxID=28452 RepID=M6DB64_9LEPT|nr:D-alanine--D-alanine ligase [Leptospira alstonii]EMJ95790.1 D-alanine--D-alanine ligase C-terminal domain protein [Leptospira alstonii serovar Sichuan str. 79601]EQA79470.1 D-alanine--D-alanine ligase C-terminal domain protein [Leptospira alstonii serovar Pingchang str. 80-412]